MLIEQGKENERLKKKLARAEKELASRRIAVESSGSMARAALELNGIFEDAERAREQYIRNLLSVEPGRVNVKEEVREYCIDMIRAAEERKAILERQALATCEEMFNDAKRKIREYYLENGGTDDEDEP